MEKSELYKNLKSGAVSLRFTKKDGSDRSMLCTQDESLIPASKLNATRVLQERDSESDNIRVFDLEVGDWRSFNYSSLKPTLLG